MARKAAVGSGTIRKKTVVRNGKEYQFWEGRIAVGYDPGTGKQKQRSFTAKTQAEVWEKMQAAAADVAQGTYTPPNKMTVGDWLDIWTRDYLEDVKPRTKDSYPAIVRNHLAPTFGAVKLQALQPHHIQSFYNSLQKAGLSISTIKNAHAVLHKTLDQAIELGYLKSNPTDRCKLPHVERREIKPLDNEAIARFVEAIQGHPYEPIFLVALFTGMREGEVLGLTWDCIDFSAGTILIKQQLQHKRGGGGVCYLASTKSGKSRWITPTASVLDILRQERIRQAERRLKAGPAWDNPMNLVFTTETGHNLVAQTVYRKFKAVATAIGRPDARFHDLRHSYAVAALQNGDDIKTVQENLGRHTAAFTLAVYGHVTGEMRKASAARMESFIKSVSNL